MNKWKEVAELFDLELEEEFCFISNGIKSVCKYKFTNEGLFYKDINGQGWFSYNDLVILSKLIRGTFEVFKLPWKPKKGDTYYCVDNVVCTDCTFISHSRWIGSMNDYTFLKAGNCFKTEEEAREKGIPLMKQIIKEFENE